MIGSQKRGTPRRIVVKAGRQDEDGRARRCSFKAPHVGVREKQQAVSLNGKREKKVGAVRVKSKERMRNELSSQSRNATRLKAGEEGLRRGSTRARKGKTL